MEISLERMAKIRDERGVIAVFVGLAMITLIGVASLVHDVEALQSCSIRPGQIIRLAEPEAEGVAFDVTDRNPPETRQQVRLISAELAAVLSLAPPQVSDQGWDAESA